MMNAPVGSRANVIGSSSATAIDDPSPGSTPTAVPRKQPTSTHSRFIGVSAPANPSAKLASDSIAHHPPIRPDGRLSPSPTPKAR
jgi:hypothetical protein